MADYSFGDLGVLRTVAARVRSRLPRPSRRSPRVAALERTTGHTLAIRERTGVRLTCAVEVLLGYAATSLDAIEEAERELDGADAIRVRPVRLGAFASAAAGAVPGALRRLARDQPDNVIALREGTSALLTRALCAGNLDIALLAGVLPTSRLTTVSRLSKLRSSRKDLCASPSARAIDWRDGHADTQQNSRASVG